jgi:hypothetical protein
LSAAGPVARADAIASAAITTTDTITATDAVASAITCSDAILTGIEHLLAATAAEVHSVGGAGTRFVAAKPLRHVRVVVADALAVVHVV